MGGIAPESSALPVIGASGAPPPPPHVWEVGASLSNNQPWGVGRLATALPHSSVFITLYLKKRDGSPIRCFVP